MKRRAALTLAGLVALLALAILLDASSLESAIRHLALDPVGLFAALAAYTGAFALRAAAWRRLVPRRVPVARLFNLLLAALFLNHVAPAKAGDLARIYGTARLGTGGARAAASVLLARLADLIALLAVLACAWPLAGDAAWGAVAAPAAVVAFSAVVLRSLVYSGITLPLGCLTEPVAKLRAALREVRLRALAVTLAWAAPAWVLEAGVLLFAARAVGLEATFAGAVVATCVAVLVTAVPLAPGGLGTYEAGMVLVLAGLGAPPEEAFTAAVLSHTIKYLYALAAAPFAFYEGVAAIGRERKVGNDEARLEV